MHRSTVHGKSGQQLRLGKKKKKKRKENAERKNVDAQTRNPNIVEIKFKACLASKF